MIQAAAGVTDQAKPDEFFVQAICSVGGLVLLFHPLVFIGNPAMLHVLQTSDFYPQWPRNYFYLPIVAGLLFLITAALRNYRPGLSGVFAVHAVIACGFYAGMVSFRTVEQMFISRAREFTPGPGSWILLLLLFIPLLSAGLLACLDSRRFEPLLATFLRSSAGACLIILFAPPLWDNATSAGFWRATIFGILYSAVYLFAIFHSTDSRALAVGAGIGYPLAVIPVIVILLGLSGFGGVRPGETQDMVLLIWANAILWIVGIGAAINIRPRQPMMILVGFAIPFAMLFGLVVLTNILRLH